MSGQSVQSIKEICDYCDEFYKNCIDEDTFNGFFSPVYDDVIRFLKLNRRVFNRNGVDFNMSYFIPLLTEAAAYNLMEGCVNDTDNIA